MPEPLETLETLDLAYVGVGAVKRLVDEARGDLGAAIAQMIDTDDQIICDRVKRAKAVLDGLDIVLTEAGR